MRFLSLLTFLAFAISSAAALPVRPAKKDEEPAKKKATLPNLTGPTNWGHLSQEGRAIFIDGHPQWYARGYIRKDGKVVLLWTWRTSNRPAPGLYEIDKDGKTLNGVWGYEDEVKWEDGENGQLTGQLQHDTTFPVKPSPEPVPDN